MIENIEALLDKLKHYPLFLHIEDWENDHFDSYLDLRDSEDFEDKWVHDYNSLEIFTYSAEQKKHINIIREFAFKQCLKVTHHSELSSYVSDDFELLAKAACNDYTSEFLTSMHEAYKKGKLPQ